jgi:hypothetical protein
MNSSIFLGGSTLLFLKTNIMKIDIKYFNLYNLYIFNILVIQSLKINLRQYKKKYLIVLNISSNLT